VAFNFDDMTAKAEQYLGQVRAEAEQIVQQARAEAAGIRGQAELKGRRAGQEQIEQTVEKQLATRLATLLPALQNVIQDIGHAKQAWLAHWEKSGIHVAAAIAQRLVRRELSQTPQITLTWIREALELAAGNSRIRIYMNPADLETLGPQVKTLIAELGGLGAAEVTPNAEISPGGCRVETRFGVIDQQVQAQLARIEEELT
jgi:flagellar assembly protein FliH